MKDLTELHKSGVTKYYLMRRCLQCSKVTEFQEKKCTQCNFMFIGEANQKDKDEYNKKIVKLEDKRELEE